MSSLLTTRRVLALALAAAAAPALTPAAPTAAASDLTDPVEMRTMPITRNGATLQLGYCGNAEVDAANTAVTDVVVVVHGDGRGACSYARSIQMAAEAAGRDSSTLVVAPHFATSDDPESSAPGRLYWGSSGWKEGDPSRTSPYTRPWTMSSFEAVDQVIDAVRDRSRFPDLTSITVAGHSAGGQFVDRYLATTERPAVATPDVERRWIVANPSSYMYLGPERVNSAGDLASLTRKQVRACPGYDTYKYGLSGRSGYVGRMTDTQIRARVAATPVTYLAGSEDTSTTDSSLDTSCEGRLQGRHRLERAQFRMTHLADVLPAGSARHELTVVQGVGHTARGMFTSPEGVAALFPQGS